MLIPRLLLLLILYIESGFSDQNAIIEADNIVHDYEKKIITAKGQVTIKYYTNELHANEIFYDLNSNKIYGYGNILIKNSQNFYIKADYIEADSKLEKAMIKNFKLNSNLNKIYAEEAIKLNNNYKLTNNFYTTCNLCQNISPEWHITSKKANYNSEKQKINYKDIILYIKNFPIIYLPYFAHSTNLDAPKSGLSFPKFSSKNNGTMILSLYLPLGKNQNIIYKPAFSASENIIHNIKFDKFTDQTNLGINLSFIKPEKISSTGKNIDYFLSSKFAFEPNENCKIGSNIDYTSNIAYKNIYNFGKDQDYLTQKLYINIYDKLDYLNINYLSFQNLKNIKNRSRNPIILPLFEAHKEFDLGKYGKQIIELNYMNNIRSDNEKRSRFIISFEWIKNLISKNGNIFDFSYKIRNDFYKFDDENRTEKDHIHRNLTNFSVKWRYPMIKTTSKRIFILEPIAKLLFNNGKDKNDLITNEDSTYRELSHFNLFANSQYDGLDKTENISKFIYGINSIADFPKSKINMMIGQMIYFRKNSHYIPKYEFATGSDLLIKFNYNYLDRFNLKYKAKFDRTYLKNRFDEFAIRYKLKNWDFYYNFASFKNKTSDNIKLYKFGSSKNLLNIILYAETGFTASSRFKKDKNAKIIYYKIGSKYKSECSEAKFSVKRDYSKSIERNKKPNIIFSFGLEFKGLN